MNILEILNLLENNIAGSVYITGGFVRDYLLSVPYKDIDVVVTRTDLKTVENFLSNYGKTNIFKVDEANGMAVEILLFKTEIDEVQITLAKCENQNELVDSEILHQDALCRDFTFNALYLPIKFKSIENISDYFGGINDLYTGIVKAVREAKDCIKDSPIRMLRMFSIASRYNAVIDVNLLQAAKKLNLELLNCCANNIRREFNKILLSDKPSRYFKLMYKTGILRAIAPEIADCYGVEQDKRYHKYDVFSHLIYAVDNCPKNLTIRLAAILHDTGKPGTRKKNGNGYSFHKHEMLSVKLAGNFLRRLVYSNKIAKDVIELVRHHMYHYTRDWTDATVRRFIRNMNIDPEYLTYERISEFPLFLLRSAERLGSGFKEIPVTEKQEDFQRRLVEIYQAQKNFVAGVKELTINGSTLIEEFNLKPGKEIGEHLRSLVEVVTEFPEYNTKEILLEITRKSLFGLDV